MTTDEQRIIKIESCREVKFSGRDIHGDMVFVDISGIHAQMILNFIKNGIVEIDNSSSKLMLN